MVKEEEKKNENTEKNEVKETPETEAKVEASEKETPKNAETSASTETPPKGQDKPNQDKSGRGRRGGSFQRKGYDKKKDSDEPELIERVVSISRVSKVVKGGKNFSFSALVVSGDGNGNAGIGLGKSNEVAEAIRKGTTNAKRNYKRIKTTGDTIPHEIIGIFKSSRVILKPASAGTGVIAGGPVRAVCDAVGIKNILTKSLGSRNSANVVKAAMNGFENLRLERRR